MIASRRPFKNDSKPYFIQCDDMQPSGHRLLQNPRRGYSLGGMIATRRPFKHDSKPYSMQHDDMQPIFGWTCIFKASSKTQI